jgi:AcrR family transcriptional regulator
MARSTRTPRRRRTAEEARREILDAAEARFVAEGPAALRLQELAAEIGVSHPTILHHFGSREGLVRAVAARSLEALQADLLGALAERDTAGIDVVALVERVFSTLGDRGQARMLAWLAISAEGHAMAAEAGPFLRVLSVMVHTRRVEAWSGPGPAPAFEDSRFVVMLATTALIGDALLGQSIRASGGFGDDPDSGPRFHKWLADLVVRHLGGNARS